MIIIIPNNQIHNIEVYKSINSFKKEYKDIVNKKEFDELINNLKMKLQINKKATFDIYFKAHYINWYSPTLRIMSKNLI